jgi:hypothetical protein
MGALWLALKERTNFFGGRNLKMSLIGLKD